MSEERLEYEKEYHDNVDKWNEEREKIRSKFSRGLFQIPLADAWKLVEVKDKVVLDYGCGEGLASKRMLEEGALKVEGIDISEGMIEQSKQNNPDERANFQVMNAEELKFNDNQFDIIFGGAILHHLDLEKAFNEIKRVLKPSGYAVFVEPLGHNPIINYQRNKTPDARTPFEHPLLKKDIKLAR
ncbi:MAG: class I SAM-dependent methyltransferase, partial [Cyanobacteriota bacterium]